jgi:hypothetical protein
MWDPLMQSMDIHDFLVCNPQMPSKNGKNKIILSFQAGFSVGLISQHPHAHTKWIPTPPTSWGRYKITIEGKYMGIPLVQDYAVSF